jgi:hypothetical protein
MQWAPTNPEPPVTSTLFMADSLRTDRPFGERMESA